MHVNVRAFKPQLAGTRTARAAAGGQHALSISRPVSEDGGTEASLTLAAMRNLKRPRADPWEALLPGARTCKELRWLVARKWP